MLFQFRNYIVWFAIAAQISAGLEQLSLGSLSEILPKSPSDLLRTFHSDKDSSSSSGLNFGHGQDDGDTSTLIVNRRIYNSSIALTIPFMSFKIPQLYHTGSWIANQAIFGVFAWGITFLVFGFSFLFTGSDPEGGRALNSRIERLSTQARSSSFNFLGSEFSRSIGMDGVQCLQKVVCQCHSPKEGRKYGIISKTVQFLFPAPLNATLDLDSYSPLREAAYNGKFSYKLCDSLYDCILDPLGSARYLAHWYGQKNENARFLQNLMDLGEEEKKIAKEEQKIPTEG